MDDRENERSEQLTRREALRLLGVTAGAVIAGPALPTGEAEAAKKTDDGDVRLPHGAEPRGQRLHKKDREREGRFGLMFKRPPAFEPPDDLLVALAAGMEEPRGTAARRLNNPGSPAGFTFLGQFIDHDLTFDHTPLTSQRSDPDAVRNFRSARYDLDSMYGLGPSENPEFYDPNDRAKLIVTGQGDPSTPDDLPRRGDGSPIIADPRNDVSVVICQLQVAFSKFHNALVDLVRSRGVRGDEVFEEARRLTRWHFQWIVVHDFLPRIVGREITDEILEERPGKQAKLKLSFYKPKNPNKPMMPVEFSVAAYRFGHSTIRPRYRVNSHVGFAFFEATPTDRNLNGFRPIPPNLVVEWRHFFDFAGKPAAQRSRRIDTDLSVPLFRLPRSVVPPPDSRISLAERNLLRGKVLGLPSGQAVAREMGLTPLSNGELGLGDEPGWGGECPLWFYVLKEAELRHRGEHLGPLGGRIVAEVLLGLLARDRNSYLNSKHASFRPEAPIAATPGVFGMGDLLRFAGVA